MCLIPGTISKTKLFFEVKFYNPWSIETNWTTGLSNVQQKWNTTTKLTDITGPHCLLIRSWTATFMRSSHKPCVGGRLSKHLQILALSDSNWTSSRMFCAIGLRTGKIPSTNPDPYFHPRPLNEPPVQRDCQTDKRLMNYAEKHPNWNVLIFFRLISFIYMYTVWDRLRTLPCWYQSWLARYLYHLQSILESYQTNFW